MLDTATLTRAIDVKIGDDLLTADGTTLTVRSVDTPTAANARATVTLGYFANGTRQTMHLPADLEVKVRSITAAVINPLIARLEEASDSDFPGLVDDLEGPLDVMRATVLVEAKHALVARADAHLITDAETGVLAALNAAIARRRA